MTTVHDSPLGKTVSGSAHYKPDLLFPIARAGNRAQLALNEATPFVGVDIWNAYELSWLDTRGKPQVAVGEFRVPADSPNLIESKSLKLYLNSFNQTRLADAGTFAATVRADLSRAAGAEVAVSLTLPLKFADLRLESLSGECIDAIELADDLSAEDFSAPRAEWLRCGDGEEAVQETLFSHLLKSNCPVTGQPDWASVHISYSGAPIDRAGLLRYLISFRGHDDFHEHCVERIFLDLLQHCAPQDLTVQARYTRRGGLDINPWRSNALPVSAASNPRLARQ